MKAESLPKKNSSLFLKTKNKFYTSSFIILHRYIGKHNAERSDGVFVVLKTNKAPEGFFMKRKHKKIINNAQPETVQTEKGLPFFTLDINETPKDGDWLKIAEKCGRYASRIVASRNLSLPDYGGMKRFTPSYTPSLLNFNTALETIRNAGADPYGISITITDRNAVHHSRIHKLLPFSATVRVITSYPEKYAYACKNALDEHGASVIIRPSYEPSEKRDVVICCDGGISSHMSSAAVFTYKQCTTGKLRFSGSGITLSESHLKIIPEEIDSVDFAGAVTELCGSREYKNSVFLSLVSSCNICDSPLPERCLGCFASGRL